MREQTKEAIMNQRAITYSRVSTTDQADRGYSLPSQQAFCRQYAERLGYGVVAELAKDASGAAAIAERPQGRQLDGMVRDRRAEAVIVYQVGRLSRISWIC